MPIFSISRSRVHCVWVVRVCNSPRAVSAQLLPPWGACRCVLLALQAGQTQPGCSSDSRHLLQELPHMHVLQNNHCIPSLYNPSEKTAFTQTTEGIITPINNISLSYCLSHNCLKAQYKHLPIKLPHSPHSQVNML